MPTTETNNTATDVEVAVEPTQTPATEAPAPKAKRTKASPDKAIIREMKRTIDNLTAAFEAEQKKSEHYFHQMLEARKQKEEAVASANRAVSHLLEGIGHLNTTATIVRNELMKGTDSNGN